MYSQETNGIALVFKDLAVMREIIIAAVNRGAIRPDELTVVGALYDKLNMIVLEMEANNIVNQQKEQSNNVTLKIVE